MVPQLRAFSCHIEIKELWTYNYKVDDRGKYESLVLTVEGNMPPPHLAFSVIDGFLAPKMTSNWVQ